MNDGLIQSEIQASIRTKELLLEKCSEVIQAICEESIRALRKGKTLFFCGNGGSFTDAQHIVGELIGRYAYDRPGIPAIALGSNFASLSAIANDYSYADIFIREVDALVQPEDIVIGLSTSGKSENVVRALQRAKEKQAFCIGWTGENQGTPLDQVCQEVLHVPSTSTPRIQESHICVGHILAASVEQALHPKA